MRCLTVALKVENQSLNEAFLPIRVYRKPRSYSYIRALGQLVYEECTAGATAVKCDKALSVIINFKLQIYFPGHAKA